MIIDCMQDGSTGEESTVKGPEGDPGQPARNLQLPHERRTARALDRLAQAEMAGGLSAEQRLNMMGSVNAARGVASNEYPNSVARKVQVRIALAFQTACKQAPGIRAL